MPGRGAGAEEPGEQAIGEGIAFGSCGRAGVPGPGAAGVIALPVNYLSPGAAPPSATGAVALLPGAGSTAHTVIPPSQDRIPQLLHR